MRAASGIQRPALLRRRLLCWFDAERRDLPWRFPADAADPYRVWISEVMLQQTRVATVVPFYRRFITRFPTLRALAAASEGEVLTAWSGLGYYARARALLGAAREALARHGGLPNTVEALRELPGFGPYTAGAVASIAFGAAAPAVDGNAARVLARLLLLRGDYRSASGRRRIDAGALALLRSTCRPGDLNQSLMELGALICRPRSPRCDACPVESHCRARRAGRERSLPPRGRRPKASRLTLAVAIVTRGASVLLERRPAAGLFGRMWGPPCVEVRAGEDPVATISAAIRREPSVDTGEFRLVGRVQRALSHRALELLVCTSALGAPLRAGSRLRLVRASGLRRLPIPTAFRAAFGVAGSPGLLAPGNSR